MTQSLSPEEERARKRAAIGLNARRPTARREVQRPPEAQERADAGWVAVLLLCVVGAATVWMLYDLVRPAQEAPSISHQLRLIVDDDFTRPHLALGAGGVEGQWDSRFANGSYRIQVEEPGNLTWSTLGLLNVDTIRLETALTLDNGASDDQNGSPLGYGALLARYANERNFYLFSVDAQGFYQVQLQKQEIWQVLQPWTPTPSLRQDGQVNHLAIEDDGVQLRFFANDELLFTVSDPRLPAGDIGLGGGTRSQGSVSAQFDWVKVFSLPVATQQPGS